MLLFRFLLSCDSFFSGERVGRIKERGTCLKLCLTTSAISLLLLACEQASKWNSHRSDQSDHDTQNLVSFLDGRHQKSTGYPAFLLSLHPNKILLFLGVNFLYTQTSLFRIRTVEDTDIRL